MTYQKPACLALPFLIFCLALGLFAEPSAPESPMDSNPLRALLIAGGCCHDYENQHVILTQGIQSRANVRVDTVWTRDTSHSSPFPLFEQSDWATGYDVIIHDECVALKTDEDLIGRILKAHETVPAVHLHCAMHSFRTDAWARHIGIKSDRHGPHLPVHVEITDSSHPITVGMENWVTQKEELYNNVEVFDAQPLAMGTQTYQKDGSEVVDRAIVAWVNTKQGAPSFSTSLGHFTHNVENPRYLDLVTRGLLWACGKLDDPGFLIPYTGPSEVREIDNLGPAAPVKLSAQSTQVNNNNLLKHAIDRNPKTRWCANSGEKPAWFQVEFEQPVALAGAEIDWEMRNEWMQYTLEVSTDGKQWRTVSDQSKNTRGRTQRNYFNANDVRFFKINILAQQRDMWASFWELRLYHPNGTYLDLQPSAPVPVPVESKVDYSKKGNVPPRPHRLTPEEEAELLKDVTVPPKFTASLFAPSQMVNYPTYVAAAPNGDLYVSSDGNASIGRDPGRGRVVRLRDVDGDGRADQVTQFIPNIDSPRGLLWDHDRLYVLHPPHITVYHDKDGDGIAEASERLISDIAFGFKDRPADHTTNGLEMGNDGWIYIAVGDFGFMKATGTDGRALQMRGGGVVRFRPDGSGLETFSDGTRNIYGLAVTPALDIFARDNTNDGGGWDVRFHHLSGLEDHGYPRLYMNFADEIIAPVNDYGGGSGVGAFYLEEPGIPDEWNRRPYTADWGRQGSFRHVLEPHGATFKEISTPVHFIKMSRPTDGDVDGFSAVYQASWKGPATFSWKGVDHGYIARVSPTGYTPEPLPDFEALSDEELVGLLRSSSSHIRRLSAQRTLLRRPVSPETTDALLALVKDPSLDLGKRVTALYAVSQRGIQSANSEEVFNQIKDVVPFTDPLMAFVTRAAGDMGLDLRTAGKPGPVPAEWLKKQLQAKSPRHLLEAIIASAFLGKMELAPDISVHLASEDALIQHTAYRALAKLGTYREVLPYLGSENERSRKGAVWALMRMHDPDLVTELLRILSEDSSPERRLDVISVLARLYHKEAEWTGDSWGTRPDTRGPYYQLAKWEESPRILSALDDLLRSSDTPPDEAAFVVSAMGRNRIQNDESLNRILALAEKNPSLIPTVIAQLAGKSDVPPRAVPLVLTAARSPDSSSSTLKESIRLLLTLDQAEAFSAVMDALSALKKNPKWGQAMNEAQTLFVNSPKLANQVSALNEMLLAQPGEPKGYWAAVGLLHLAQAKGSSVEVRAASQKAVDEAWPEKIRKIALIEAAIRSKNPYLNDRIRAAMQDPDPQLKKYTDWAAQALRIQKPGEDKTPKIGTLKPAEAVTQATEYKQGDAALGEAVLTRAGCMACHTVRKDEPPKGPYLGSIAGIYQRKDLAEAILLPNKTMAQGFKTNVFTLNDGRILMGFVTDEKGDSVTIRDITSAEHTFKKTEITNRDTISTSLMPAGLMDAYTVHELASLLDYLEGLVNNQAKQ